MPRKANSEDIDKKIQDLIEEKRRLEIKEKEAAKKKAAVARARQVKASAEYAKQRAEIKSMIKNAKKIIDHICTKASRNRLTEADVKVLNVLSRYPEEGSNKKESKEEE